MRLFIFSWSKSACAGTAMMLCWKSALIVFVLKAFAGL